MMCDHPRDEFLSACQSLQVETLISPAVEPFLLIILQSLLLDFPILLSIVLS